MSRRPSRTARAWRRLFAGAVLSLALFALGAAAAGVSPASVLETISSSTSTTTSSTSTTDPTTSTADATTSSTQATSTNETTSSTVASTTTTVETTSSTVATTTTDKPKPDKPTATLSPTVTTASAGSTPSVGTYDQCSNDTGSGYADGCHWINGNLNQNNSLYAEGDSTVQRLWLTGMDPGTTHTVTFTYGTTKGGKHAYDYLTTWDASEGWVTPADRCEGITGCETSSTESTKAIPVDPNAGGFDAGTREFVMRGGTLTGATVPTLASGSYGGDSETAITVSFTAASSGDMCSTKSGVTTCGVALWFGAHVAEQANWGLGTGAASISGSPYHVALSAVDGAAIGQRDNQMQSNTIPQTGTLTITKAFDPGTSGFTGNFTVAWDCNDGTAHDGSAQLAAGGSTTVTGIPLNTQCTVTEPNLPTAPTGWTFGSPSIDPSQPVTLATSATVTVTVTNTISRDTGSLKILKTVSNPDGATLPASFAVNYDCGGSYTGQVNVSPGSPATVNGIPTGSSCSVTEVAPAAIAGYTWGTVTYSPASIVISSKGGTFELTVGNSITRDKGSLQILKTLSNPDGASVPASFTVNYDCGGGLTGQRTVAPGSPATVNGIPTGSTCSVSEVAPAPISGYTWGTVTYTPASVVISTKGQTFDITVGNSISRDKGSLKVLKTVSNPDGATLPASFAVNYDCGSGYTGQVNVSPGNPATVNGIPTGNTCSLSEVAPAAIAGYTWGTVTYSPASVVISSKGQTFELTVGNSITRDRGSLKVMKTVSNPDGATLPASFAVNYDCGGSYTGQVNVSPGNPATVPNIPTGSTCSVTEVAPAAIPGYTWGTVTYTPASVVISTKGQTFDITVGNSITRDRGSLKVLKTVSNPDGATLPASFAVNYDCGGSYTGQVDVAPGSPATVDGIPSGSTCSVSEVAPADIAGYTWGTVTYSPASVVIDTGATVELTVGNSITRDRGSLKVLKTISNPDGATLPASFAVNYDCGGSYTGQVDVAPGSPATVDGIPTGSTCSLSEVAPADIPGYTWGTVTYSPASVDISAKGQTFELTVGNSITRDRGSLKILKTVENPDQAFLPRTFAVDYDCGEGYTGTALVAPLGPATVSGIPTGRTCTVTEVAPDAIPGYTWGTVTYSPESVTIADKDATVELTVGNSITRDRGSLKILKTLSNPDGASVPASFTVNYSCGSGYTGQKSVSPGSPATVSGIPTGNTCTVTEVAPAAIPGFTWGTIGYSPASVVIAKDATVELSVGNSIRRVPVTVGSLRILKSLSNPDGANVPAGFAVDYNCGSGYAGRVNVAPGSPATVSNLPAGNSCSVLEVAPAAIPGYTWGPVTYSSSPVAVSANATVEITVGNSITRNPLVDLAVTKVDTPDPVVLGSKLTYRMVVTNNGPDTATAVQLADPIPAWSDFVSVTTTKGTCTGGTLVQCQLGTMAAKTSETVTVVVRPTATGTLVNTATVVGHESETDTTNNTATARTLVTAPFTPPVVKPKPACYAVAVAPKTLTVGQKAKLKVNVKAAAKPVAGARVQLKGPAISKLSGPTDKRGRTAVSLKPTKPGILTIRPVKAKGCSVARVGIVGVFTPPVTG